MIVVHVVFKVLYLVAAEVAVAAAAGAGVADGVGVFGVDKTHTRTHTIVISSEWRQQTGSSCRRRLYVMVGLLLLPCSGLSCCSCSTTGVLGGSAVEELDGIRSGLRQSCDCA